MLKHSFFISKIHALIISSFFRLFEEYIFSRTFLHPFTYLNIRLRTIEVERVNPYRLGKKKNNFIENRKGGLK
jgi:hypothetical protein